MNVFRQWMILATKAEQESLAAEAGTSRNYLYQIADGRRKVSADMAARLEGAAAPIAKASKKRLPKLTRADLCEACRDCPLRRGCRGGQ